ncbi:MAG: SusC/RagA family TonB-linked outer membrane protein, partial [Paludibacter sp.]
MKKIKNSKRFLRNVTCLFILFSMSSAGLMAQVKISGIISDSNKEPLIGVNVTVKGLQTGTISDFNGKYSIQVPSTKSILVFSYIGHRKLEKAVGTSTVIDILLEEDSKQMDEVVVVAYGTQKKSHLTGSVASLKGDKLDEIPVSRLDQALQGKMAGVQVLSLDPQAGEAPVIRVRGMGSISANNAPLVVIDGFPTPDGLSMISPGDVESVEVLKDAASAALYGSRAAGGVILITTKSGNVTKPKYNFKMYTGVKTALKLPVMLNTQQYTQLLYDEAAQRELDPSIDGTNMAFNNIAEADKASYLIEKYLDDQPTNWLNEGLRKFGMVQNYQLSAAGGDKNLKYFVSGNYTKEDGIMKASTYDKYSFRAKVDVKLSKAITIGINLTPTYSQKETPAVDLTDYMRTPTWLPVRHNTATAALTGKTVGDYASLADFFSTSISGIGIDGNTWNVDAASLSGSSNQNPVSIRERTSILTDDYKLLGNTYLTIDFMPGLQFKTSNGGYMSYREYNKKEMTSATKAGVPNSLTRQMTLHSELLSENTLNYNKKLGNHEFGAMLGFTMQKTNDS